VSLSLVKELRNLTDSQMFEAFHFDMLIHHALGIASGEVSLAEHTMYCPARVAGDPAAQKTFDLRVRSKIVPALTDVRLPHH
jgi:hypothetical protein